MYVSDTLGTLSSLKALYLISFVIFHALYRISSQKLLLYSFCWFSAEYIELILVPSPRQAASYPKVTMEMSVLPRASLSSKMADNASKNPDLYLAARYSGQMAVFTEGTLFMHSWAWRKFAAFGDDYLRVHLVESTMFTTSTAHHFLMKTNSAC